ncbi:Hypothetical protein, predicted lipoprotein [Metamycoplasma alkalescens 14918]|uniref:Tail specific protease domain-containing protein n=1 Tax=Metamycoplasma alkalescens 14918 TaxID=1188234 RepID=N9UA62_9BACT|nr:S41 family peptidase [Metamycoplasma alkalescens]ENY53788.1 Hypothetical protein, predicted lipoprotein [Metamycoplasma alkalescens 14918]
MKKIIFLGAISTPLCLLSAGCNLSYNKPKEENNKINPNKQEQKFNISYYLNGKLQKVIKAKKGDKIIPVNFTKPGFKFVGYFLDKEYTKKLNTDHVIDSNVDIFLKFELNIQKVNFIEKSYNLHSLPVINLTNNTVKLSEHNNIQYIDLEQFLSIAKDVLIINDKPIDDVLYNGKMYKLNRQLNSNYDGKIFTIESINKYDSKDQNEKSIINKSYIKFDYLNQIIKISGFDFFENVKPYEKEGKIEFYNPEKSNFSEIEIDLSNYNINMIEQKGKLYLPFVLLNQLLLGENENQLYFNNDKVYIFEFTQVHDNNSNETKKALLSNTKSRPISKKLKEFEYNYLNLLLDVFYPIKPKSKTFAKFLETYKLGLLDDNDRMHFNTLNTLIKDLDDIHTKPLLWGNQYISNLDKEIENLSNSSSYKHKERVKKFREIEKKLVKLEISKDLKESEIRYTKDKKTAIIKIDQISRYTTEGLNKQLTEAKAKGAVNIVFDLSLNRGGSVQATYEILGYLSDKNFKYNKYYPLTQDTKIIEIKSNVGKKDFNYFILTSPITYSAGSLLAAVSKNNNLAKIIGYQSAGGVSEVKISVLPTGLILRRSGNYTLSDFNKNSYEWGVKPDFEFDKKNGYEFEKLFNLDYIQEVVNQLTKNS